MITKSIALAAVLGTAGIATLGGTLGLFVANADETDLHPPVIEKLAERFNLNPDEVAAVFDETREERMNERFDHMVDRGILTKDQVDMVKQKAEEFKTRLDEIMKSEMTADDRLEAIHDLRGEIRSWAEENGVPAGAVMGGARDKVGGKIERGFNGDRTMRRLERFNNMSSDQEL